MKNITEQELQAATPIPAKMTRAEKLKHWASLVRACPVNPRMVSNIEHFTEEQLAGPLFFDDLVRSSYNVFAIATTDPVLQGEGLKATVIHQGIRCGSARDVMDFFELSQAQLHEFACDCGGMISKEEMASRIERLA